MRSSNNNVRIIIGHQNKKSNRCFLFCLYKYYNSGRYNIPNSKQLYLSELVTTFCRSFLLIIEHLARAADETETKSKQNRNICKPKYALYIMA